MHKHRHCCDNHRFVPRFEVLEPRLPLSTTVIEFESNDTLTTTNASFRLDLMLERIRT